MSKIPETFIHKQTLVNAARYWTQELENFQKKLQEAESHMAEKEYEVFQQVRSTVLESYNAIKNVSQKISYTDLIQSLSDCAYKNNYTRPEMISSLTIDIE